jgi:hypothetical protein
MSFFPLSACPPYPLQILLDFPRFFTCCTEAGAGFPSQERPGFRLTVCISLMAWIFGSQGSPFSAFLFLVPEELANPIHLAPEKDILFFASFGH